ncbi:hypothetical protein [Reichenbachiella sp. MALMAid0571]|uniref:hypothetical protein n=1 Tax=Reichenbachiella sp. MALMAid0571 TaxID=3143939 RepID=UPI0032E02447
MENTEFLKYFINEDLYLIKAENDLSQQKVETVSVPEKETIAGKVEEHQVVEEPKEVLTPSKPPAFKGANKKGILILVEDAGSEFLNEKDFTYLMKILGAVKLTIDEIALVNVNKTNNYVDIEFTNAIVFTSNHSLQISNPTKYIPSVLSNKKILLADPLDQIAASVELRKALWDALKNTFQA